MKKRCMLKKVVAFALIAMMLCLTACHSGQEDIYSKYTEESSRPVSSQAQPEVSEPAESKPVESEEKAPKKDLSGELTISDMRKIPDYGTDAVVAAFQKEYPNVKITVDYSLPEGEKLTTEAYTAYSQRLATQLMGGESADIISYWDGMVSAKNIAENGYALDLYEWMDNDPDFHKEDYFTNLFEALEYKDKLYQLPVLFSYTAVVLNSHITDELGYTFQPWDKIDYQTIISIYKEAAEKGLLADGFTMEFEDLMSGGYLFQEVVYPDYFDEDTDMVNFDSPEFIQYLTDTKALPSNRKMEEGAGMVGGGTTMQDFAQSNASANTSLTLSTGVSMADFPNLVEEIEGCTPPLLLMSEKETCTFVSGLQYMVSASCKNPELAWEFLKFAIGHVENPGYYTVLEGGTDFTTGYLPVERANFRAFSKLYAQVDQASRSNPDGWMIGFDPATASCPLDDTFLDQAEKAAEKFNVRAAMPYALGTVLQPILNQYYDTDSLSAEECARQMQEKAELFLAE